MKHNGHKAHHTAALLGVLPGRLLRRLLRPFHLSYPVARLLGAHDARDGLKKNAFRELLNGEVNVLSRALHGSFSSLFHGFQWLLG